MTTMKITTFALAGFALLAATPALARDPCIQNIDIYNYHAINNRKLVVEDFHHRKVLLTLIGTCDNLKFKERLAFKSPGGSDLSCLARGDEVISRGPIGPSVCAITHIDVYTPAMEAADRQAEYDRRHHHSDNY